MEGWRKLGSVEEKEASEGQGRSNANVGGGGGANKPSHAQTWKHTHTCTLAPHRTLNQSATDKKIMPLSFLECSLLYPLNYHRPSPTHTKHCLSLFPALLLQAVVYDSGSDAPIFHGCGYISVAPPSSPVSPKLPTEHTGPDSVTLAPLPPA